MPSKCQVQLKFTHITLFNFHVAPGGRYYHVHFIIKKTRDGRLRGLAYSHVGLPAPHPVFSHWNYTSSSPENPPQIQHGDSTQQEAQEHWLRPMIIQPCTWTSCKKQNKTKPSCCIQHCLSFFTPYPKMFTSKPNLNNPASGQDMDGDGFYLLALNEKRNST